MIYAKFSLSKGDIGDLFDKLSNSDGVVFGSEQLMQLTGRFIEAFPSHFNEQCQISKANYSGEQGSMDYIVNLFSGKVSVDANLVGSKFSLSHWGRHDLFSDTNGNSAIEICKNLDNVSGLFMSGKYISYINSDKPLIIGRKDGYNNQYYDANAVKLLFSYLINGEKILFDKDESFTNINFYNAGTLSLIPKDLSINGLISADETFSNFFSWFIKNKAEVGDAMEAVNEAISYHRLSQNVYMLENGDFTQVTIERMKKDRDTWLQRMNETLIRLEKTLIPDISQHLYKE